jgi:hypothetical protein
MRAWFDGLLFVESLLLIGLAVFAILAYRSNRSAPFLLLMLAAISYFIHRFAPVAVGLALGWGGKASTTIHAWYHSWWSFGLSKVFDLLFLVFLVASLVSFYRSRRSTV